MISLTNFSIVARDYEVTKKANSTEQQHERVIESSRSSGIQAGESTGEERCNTAVPKRDNSGTGTQGSVESSGTESQGIRTTNQN